MLVQVSFAASSRSLANFPTAFSHLGHTKDFSRKFLGFLPGIFLRSLHICDCFRMRGKVQMSVNYLLFLFLFFFNSETRFQVTATKSS